MLPEGEDLLQQLSGELGIPEFLDDLPIPPDTGLGKSSTLYDTLMSDSIVTESVFDDFTHLPVQNGEAISSMETTSTFPDISIDFNPAFPPSPSNSDSSASSTVDAKDGIVSCEISPPVSPPAIPMLAGAGASIVSVSDLSNVKIPIPKIPKPKPSPQKAPLILTSEQLAQLTQNGVLQLNNSGMTKPVLSQPTNNSAAPLVIKSEPSPLTLGATPKIQSIPHNVSQEDMKALKRQQRMIKNRESACLSRKKKKEYVTNLEEQLNGLAKENQLLKRDNEVLRQKIRELEAEKTHYWANVPKAIGANARKATALLAVLCVLSVNVSTLSNVYRRPSPEEAFTNDFGLNDRIKRDISPISMDGVPHVNAGSRTLLWDESPDSNDTLENSATFDPKCSRYFNQSESIRLDKLLRGLFQSEESLNSTTRKTAPISPVRSAPAKPYETSLGPYDKPKARGLTGGFYQMLITNPEPRSRTGITLYDQETPRFSYESFFEAIHRREDTFYVVSFSGDHLLLPASARNQSSRPRMSLLLPSLAVPLNDSMQPPENHVAMMQIDCEVMNTRLLHIHQDSIPAHLSHGMRADSNNGSLQRNESHEDGVHHHAYDNGTAGASSTSNGEPDSSRLAMGYEKDESRYAKPNYIQEHDFPRLPSASSESLHFQHQSRKYWKRQQHLQRAHHQSP